MLNFVEKSISGIKGKQSFKQIIVLNEGEDSFKIQEKINQEEKIGRSVRKGVLDEYEDALEAKYKSSFAGILAVIDRVANLQSVGEKRFKDVTPSKEEVKEYEFKYGDLRVFAIKITNGQLVLLGGYKNNQKKDFSRFRSLKKQYLESVNIKK